METETKGVSAARAKHLTGVLFAALKNILFDALRTSLELYKVMIPLLIATRLLDQLGVVRWIGQGLAPLMGLAGLPGSMGLVWATSMVVGFYPALLLIAALAPSTPLTVAQATVIGSMIAIAHGLPVEGRIAQQAGLRLWFQLGFRILVAFIYGVLFFHVCRLTGFLQASAHVILDVPQQDAGWFAWSLSQVKNLASIFLIILGLMTLMRLLNWLKITDVLVRVLSPVLRQIGIGAAAVPITIIGMVLGLTFGSGLVINEARSGRIAYRDVFFSLSLMSVFHSLIEDTLVLLAIGADMSGLFWGRAVFVFLVFVVMVRLLRRLPAAVFARWFIRSEQRVASSAV